VQTSLHTIHPIMQEQETREDGQQEITGPFERMAFRGVAAQICV
jgi:hypothetical protein